MNAEEARRSVEATIKRLDSAEISEVYLKIEEAVKQGDYYVCIETSLRKSTVDRLKNDGYLVSMGSQYNDSFVNISWR